MPVKEGIATTFEWQLERQYSEELGRTVIVKKMLNRFSEETESQLLEQLLQFNKIEALLTFIYSQEMDGRYNLFYEDFTGISLAEILKSDLTVPQFFKIAKSLVNACHELHQQKLAFHQLNPMHILVAPNTFEVKLVPSSNILGWGMPNVEDHRLNLFCLAPEQSGRIQLVADERADLYALGSIFYQLLVGDLFSAANNDELLFQIVTKTPDFKKITAIEGCKQLAKIIEKLLKKNPEDRYQNILTLKNDLQLLEKNQLLHIAQREQLYEPKPTTDICGRYSEHRLLLETYEQVANGSKQLLFVQGPSGVGKTALLQLLKSEVVAHQGYYLEHKFEERHQRDMDSIVRPLRQLLKQLYFKGNDVVEAFKKEIIRLDVMVTENFIDLVPELRVLLDKSVHIAKDDIDFTMQQNMYLFSTIKKILEAITSQKSPIVLSVEDCQWASLNALDNILRIYNQHSNGYLFVTLSARSEHIILLDDLLMDEKYEKDVQKITLANLRYEDVLLWLQKSIVLSDDVLPNVAYQLYQHTKGNPLFVKEVFNSLVKNRAFYFHEERQVWTVDDTVLLQVIERTDLIDFIVGRIQFLSNDAQQLLINAACVGRVFSTDIVQHMCVFEEVLLRECLEELVANGFIVLSPNHQNNGIDETFQFVHDRIHETAYAMLNTSEKQQKHYKIAKYLQQYMSQDLLFQLVEQYQLSGDCVTEEEKIQLSYWHYDLALHSKNTGLYEQALRLFLTSESLLPVNHWETLREHSTNLFMYIGECFFLARDYEQSDYYIREALKHARTSLEKLKIYRIMTFLYFESEDSAVVLDVGYLALKECGIQLPTKPQKHHVLQEYIKLKWALKNKTNESLLSLPAIEKQEMDLLIQIIVNIISSSFRMDSNLTGILLLRTMRLMLQYGIIAESAIVFINYALVLVVGFGDIKEASRFGRLAVELADQQNNAYIKTRVYFAYGTFIHYWEHNYEGSILYLQSAQHYARQCGLHSVMSAASCFIVATQWMKGQPLNEMYQSVCEEQRHSNDSIVLAKDFLTEFQGWIEGLRRDVQKLDWHYEFKLQQEHAVVVMHHILRLQMSYLFNNEQEAKSNLERLRLPMQESFNLITAPLYFLYRALWQIDWLKQDLSKLQQRQYKSEIKESLRKFKKWAKASPHNFEHLYQLLLAEEKTLKGQDEDAAILYDQALQLARLHHFIHDKALINERAAKFYERQRDHQKAESYLKQGIDDLLQWGTVTLTNVWGSRTDFSPNYGPAIVAPAFDLKTVIETTQSLSKEIRMEVFLQKLLFSLLKHSNATSGYFIRRLKNELYYTAKVEAEEMAFQYEPQGVTLKKSIQMMAQFVLECDEPVLITNVQKNALFLNSSTDAKSILCLPVHHKDEVIAVLYLENNVLCNAFNYAQLELIQMVTTQIAVSLENATIYEELEQRVAERTMQYEDINKHLVAVNEKLERNEFERRQLFQSISSELRSPIMSTLKDIDVVLDDFANASNEQYETLRRSKDQLLSLNYLINDLFELAKLEAGRFDFEMSYVSAAELFELCATTFRAQVEEAGLTFKTNYLCEQEGLLIADVKSILRVVGNIITNAIKYTEQGSISLTVETNENQLVCTIEDTGVGIPKQVLHSIVDSFFIGSDQKEGHLYGSGLAISRLIIEQHKGSFIAKSENHKGACVRFMLPLTGVEKEH